MYCSNCGNEILLNEKFCGNCGNKVVAIVKEQTQEIPEKGIQKLIVPNKSESLQQSKPTAQVILKTKNGLSEEKIPDNENSAKEATIKFLNTLFPSKKPHHIQQIKKNKTDESPTELQPKTFELKSDDFLKTSESKNKMADSTPEISNHKKETTAIIEKDKIEKASKDIIETIFEKLENNSKGNSVLALIIFTIASFALANFINHSEVLAKFLVFIPAIFLWFKWLKRIEFF